MCHILLKFTTIQKDGLYSMHGPYLALSKSVKSKPFRGAIQDNSKLPSWHTERTSKMYSF